jgi:hypothetical protein
LKPVERLVFRIGTAVSGFFNLVPALRDGFKGPRFDHGYPELYPIFEELESGEVRVREYARPASRLDALGASSLPAE